MRKMIGLGLALLFFSSHSQAVDLGVALKAGINGVGIDLSVGLTETVNLRLTVAGVDIDDEDETVTVGDTVEADIDGELDFDYGANAVLIDWHVFNGGFRVTAGMLKNNGEADFDGTLLGAFEYDGIIVAPGDLENGAIGGELDLGDSYQPYIGVGWGRGAGGDGGFSFSLDVGVAVLETDVSLDAALASGSSLSDSELRAALDEAERDAEDELDDYEFWPVIALGVNYAF